MKKKFIILTLCFTIIFSSINFNKSYAFDGGVISVPMLGVVATLAIGTGLVIDDIDDIYDLGRSFYNTFYDRFEEVKNAFDTSVVVVAGGAISVGKAFLDIYKEFAITSNLVSSNVSSNGHILNGYYGLMPVYDYYKYPTSASTSSVVLKLGVGTYKISKDFSINVGDLNSSGFSTITYTFNGVEYTLDTTVKPLKDKFTFFLIQHPSELTWGRLKCLGYPGSGAMSKDFLKGVSVSSNPSIGHLDNLKDKEKDDGSVDVYVPGNLGSLVGSSPSDVFVGGSYDLPVGGQVVLPGVSSPSIDVSDGVLPGVNSGDTSVPGDTVVPNDSIFAKVKDFIISLVVPSDTFWTDTWGGLYNSFTSSFPGVDMDNFNNLVTCEKKFPNIDINIMGVNGRVVNGDVINSIVDWLRPIVAGFMMLCLMLFNYRKIYKLIRNTEPFGGIAPGTSDFKTGISEYNKEPVIKGVDMASEYRAWKENGGK